jgi:hypothetical protein
MNLLINEMCWGYAASVFLLTFLVLSYVTINPSKFVKITMSVSLGLVLGTLWYYTTDSKTTTLLFSFLFQSVFYEWGVKELMKKLKVTYDNKKGVV